MKLPHEIRRRGAVTSRKNIISWWVSIACCGVPAFLQGRDSGFLVPKYCPMTLPANQRAIQEPLAVASGCRESAARLQERCEAERECAQSSASCNIIDTATDTAHRDGHLRRCTALQRPLLSAILGQSIVICIAKKWGVVRHAKQCVQQIQRKCGY